MTTDTELTATLSREERAAVRHAAREMRAFRQRHMKHCGKDGERCRTGGQGKNNGKATPRPDQSIADLHESGAIDGRREAALTALALRVSRGEASI